MVNILGGDHAPTCTTGTCTCMARDPRLRVHLYGKEVRPGRKVGHVNVYGDDLDDCSSAPGTPPPSSRGDIDE